MKIRLKTIEFLLQLKRQRCSPGSVGTMSGFLIMLLDHVGHVLKDITGKLFWTLLPIHVMLSSHVTAVMHRFYSSRRLLRPFLIGCVDSVGIATLVFRRNQTIDWKLALVIDPPTDAMALLGGYYAHRLPVNTLKYVFAVLLVMAGFLEARFR